MRFGRTGGQRMGATSERFCWSSDHRLQVGANLVIPLVAGRQKPCGSARSLRFRCSPSTRNKVGDHSDREALWKDADPDIPILKASQGGVREVAVGFDATQGQKP
jgi:hypothetical protein